MNIIKKVLSIFSKSQKKKFNILIVTIFFGAMLEMLAIGLVFPFIKIIINPTQIPYLDLFSFNTNSNGFFYFIIGLFFLFFLIKNIILSLIGKFQLSFVKKFNFQLSNILFEKYLRQKYFKIIKSDTNLRVKTIANDITTLTNSIIALCYLFFDIIVIVFICIVLIYIDPIAAICFFLSLVLFGIFFYFYLQNKIKAWGIQSVLSEKLKFSCIYQGFYGIRDIKINNTYKNIFKNFSNTNEIFLQTVFKKNFVQSITRHVVEVFAVLSFVIFLAFILLQSSFEQSLPTLGVFAAASFKLLPSLNRLLISKQTLKFIEPIIDRIKIDATKKEILDYGDKFTNKKIEKLETINLNNVSFYYDSPKNRVLEKVNLKINLNKNTVLIGENGSGKSTFLDLISGLLDPSTGKILVNSKNLLDDETKALLHSNISYLPQNPFIINGTIKDNIVLGNDKIDIGHLKKCLLLADLNNFVRKKSRGLGYSVGLNGNKLSGGEKQKIALARAMYRNPKIIILDEATSAIDELSQSKIIKNLKAVNLKTKFIIVAHTQKMLELCDKAYEIKNKKIIKKNIGLIKNSRHR